MMTPERRPVDQDVRDLVTTDLGSTFLLEAGAGTGKTRVLVDRYVRCVLDAEHGSGDVRTVAAITFTEKAAGELRQRVREEFEARAAGAPAGSAEAEAIERALDGLDDAPISTIHGFAGRLLREFPVEARVDPAFEQLDGLGSELERARLWEEWLEGLAETSAGAPDDDGARVSVADAAGAGHVPSSLLVARRLSRLLRAGVRLDKVQELAIGARGVFGERYDLDPAPAPPEEPELGAALSELAAPLARLRDYCGAACVDPVDRGFAATTDLMESLERLLADPPSDVDQLAARLFALPAKDTKTAPGGAMKGWDAALGGKEELQLRYKALVAGILAARDLYAEFVTGLAVSVADSFARWAGTAQLALGRLDFTDLLGCLRDLLVEDWSARAALQGRFRYVLVDEFQDTDPLQAEIAFYLCEREPAAADWREVVLEPGKLFVVGDPKQSIYRFRRADISLYDQVRRVVEAQPGGRGKVLAIRQNFRTTPSIVGWVNNVFAGVFDDDQEEGRQPGYQWVDPYRPAAEGARIALVLGREYGSAAGESEAARRDEARAIAALLIEMHGPAAARWRVQDRGAATPDPTVPSLGSVEADVAEPLRDPRWGDVALLFRATTGLETYEQALREAGVPYRVDGGKSYFERREVADALLCLRAADDPSDEPALYGALHSSFFGFSDDDLFLFWAAGGRFDLFAGERQPPGHDGIVAALDTLRALYERRAEREPYELAAELVRLAHGTEFMASSGGGAAQAIANLEKLVERTRAFSGAGGGGLGSFLAWAAEAGDAAGEQESQVDDEGDVVHILTIHKAKGLEYPIVVLVGGALANGGRGGEPIVDRAGRRLAVKLKAELPGAVARDLEPQAYTALSEREKEMSASEARRLLYVATTRARDRLVLSCFGKLVKKDGDPTSALLGPAAQALPEIPQIAPVEETEEGGVLILPPREPEARLDRGAAPDAAAMIAVRAVWTAEREALLAAASKPARATSPSGLEHVDDEVRAGGPGAPAGRAKALALGSAVHAVMELCDLRDEGSIAPVAADVTADLGRPDLAHEAIELARACWRSAPVRAAAAASAGDPDAVHRELPIGALVDGTIVNGAVDLLYRDGDEWVVVDYKTDRAADDAVLRERYAPQGAAYAVVIERATGGPVREVVFVAARTGGLDVHIPVDDALRASVAHEVDAAVSAGRAIRPDELAAAAPSA
jgi:ATP-dependent helicase/nuclease subunit A